MDLLKTGDTVAIAATARKVNKDEMQAAITLLGEWGLRVKLAEGLFLEDHQYAGSDSHRAASLQKLLDDKEVKAIFCARGGYGTVRICDQLQFDAFLYHPKWIIGFSDITVLHAHLFRKLGYTSIHGPMALHFMPEKYHAESIEHLRRTLFEGPQPIRFPKHPLNQHTEKQISGKLIGGNLSVLYSLLHSPSDPDYERKILVLEDLDEYLYHIDRMMVGLKRAGKLEKLAGLVVGGMSDMKDNTVPFGKSTYEIIAEAISEYSTPVVFGAPIGHEPHNLSLIHGSRYKLVFGKEISLLPEPAAAG